MEKNTRFIVRAAGAVVVLVSVFLTWMSGLPVVGDASLALMMEPALQAPSSLGFVILSFVLIVIGAIASFRFSLGGIPVLAGVGLFYFEMSRQLALLQCNPDVWPGCIPGFNDFSGVAFGFGLYVAISGAVVVIATAVPRLLSWAKPPLLRLGKKAGEMKKTVGIVLAVVIVAAAASYVLIPSVSPIPTFRDSDGDGVADAADFWDGDGGLLVSIDWFEVDAGITGNMLIVTDGIKRCTWPKVACPPIESVSFRLTVEIGDDVHRFVSSHGDFGREAVPWQIGIPDDTETIAFRLEVGIFGTNVAPNPTRNVLNRPFNTTFTTTQFEGSPLPDGSPSVITGNLTYSIAPIDCPCFADLSDPAQGGFDTSAWPPEMPINCWATDWSMVAPCAIDTSLSRSADGANYIVTFVDVPLPCPNCPTPASVISLVVFNSDGIVVLFEKTPLTSLSGNATYVPTDLDRMIAAGDRILLSTSAFPSGSTYLLIWAFNPPRTGEILRPMAVGTLT